MRMNFSVTFISIYRSPKNENPKLLMDIQELLRILFVFSLFNKVELPDIKSNDFLDKSCSFLV